MSNEVLIISATNIISGAEYVLGDYIKNSGKKNYINILTSNKKAVCEFYKSLSIKQLYCSKYFSQLGAKKNKKMSFILKKLFYFFTSFFILSKILFKNRNIKVVYANNTGDIIYSIFAKILRKKFIINIHDSLQNDKFLWTVVNLFKNFVDFYIVDSKTIKQDLLHMGVDKKNIKVLYTGLTYKNFIEKKIAYPIIFGWIGLLEDRKNPLEFIEILNFLNKKGLQLKGKMVYKVVNLSLKNKLIDKIKKYNLNIELIGTIKREELDNFYQSLHFLILTSKSEALPTVILEAMNNSIPVIAHDIDGVAEIIINEKNGYLYNHISDFNNILENLLNLDKLKYQQMIKNANQTIEEKFSLDYKIGHINEIIWSKNK